MFTAHGSAEFDVLLLKAVVSAQAARYWLQDALEALSTRIKRCELLRELPSMQPSSSCTDRTRTQRCEWTPPKPKLASLGHCTRNFKANTDLDEDVLEPEDPEELRLFRDLAWCLPLAQGSFHTSPRLCWLLSV